MLSVTHSAPPASQPFFGCHPTIEWPVIIYVEGWGAIKLLTPLNFFIKTFVKNVMSSSTYHSEPDVNDLPLPIYRELKMETFSERRQLQPDVTSWFVQNCACSCSPHCRRAPVGDVKLVCLALWREREYLTFISIRFVAFSNQNFADYRP